MSFSKLPKAATVRRLAQATAVAALVGLSFSAAPALARSTTHVETTQAVRSSSALALNNAIREL